MAVPAVDLVPRGERKQGDVAGLLDGAGQAALVRGANAGEPPGHDLAALGHKLLQQPHIAVRNRIDLLGTELADFLAAEELAAATRTAAWAWTTRTTTSRTRRCLWCCAALRRPCLCFFRHIVSSLLVSVRRGGRFCGRGSPQKTKGTGTAAIHGDAVRQRPVQARQLLQQRQPPLQSPQALEALPVLPRAPRSACVACRA